MGKKKAAREVDAPIAVPLQGDKFKKKHLAVNGDEYSILTEPSQELRVKGEKMAPDGGKKKGKTGKPQHQDEEDEDMNVGEVKVPQITFAGKKGAKSKKSRSTIFCNASFELLHDKDIDRDDVVHSEEEEKHFVSLTGKKKPSKGSKKSGGSFSIASAFDDENKGKTDCTSTDKGSVKNDAAAVICFSGKKKKSKSSKKSCESVSAALNFNALDGDNDTADDDAAIVFTGKRSPSKSSEGESQPEMGFASKPRAHTGDGLGLQEDGNKVVAFSKKEETTDVLEPKHVTAAVQPDDSEVETKGSAFINKETSKKKKKRGVRREQEEEDLDKILAEIGVGEKPPISKPQPCSTLASSTEDEKSEPIGTAEVRGRKGGEEEAVEDFVSIKKKLKKKHKEKKVVAAETTREANEEMKNAAFKKKIPKHVREMQEALARRKEAEERKKREEEEILRKEEEERRRQEELEKQEEEAKRRKKEREKEKLLRRRQEGKLLTGKQKEQQRRLETMRNQFLTKKENFFPTPAKRPIYYTTKNSKGHQAQTNDAVRLKEGETEQEILANDALKETDKVEEEDEKNEGKKFEIEDNGATDSGVEDNDEDDWDAKSSWDNDDLSLPVKRAFDDEESELLGNNKMSKKAAAQPVVHHRVAKSLDADLAVGSKLKKHPEVEATDEDRRKEEAEMLKKEAPTTAADSHNKQCEEAVLRSPICCIMGHVDAGKTKLLDCIRGTNVQEGEAGGITQQIGATYFPAENIRDRTKQLKADAKLKVPGLLVIDTPGHESFTNLRSRGSGLCDISILVVDIMHGLEPQTIESLNLLKMRNTKFIVALNKVDRLYGWKTCHNAPFFKALKQQNKDVQNEFNMRLKGIITQFQEQGLNTKLYYKNKEMGETFSIVPTSAISGEGIPDLLLLLVQWAQKTMVEKLTFSDVVQCTVLEVKVVEGHGTTIDVVLVNGVLREGDHIVLCGMQGTILTTIRALLTPHPMKELRVKGTFLHHKEIKAAQGVKITAQGLEHAIAGSGLYVVRPNDDVEKIKQFAMKDTESVLNRVDKSGEGVWVQASTLGSMEALLEFLKSPCVNIPVSGISIGPVHKKDVMKASIMLEKKKEYATVLAFDVKVTPDAQEYADESGVKIISADVIYHLFDQFKAYIKCLEEEKKRETVDEAVFPCVCKIIPGLIYNKKGPIILGVDVLEGIIKVGTPLCVPSRDFIDIGQVSSIASNYKPVDYAKKGQRVSVKIEGKTVEEKQKMFGRHFEVDDELVSHISRRSIDILKANYRDDLSMNEWKLVVKLKNLFKIL